MKVTVATRQMCAFLRIYNVSPCVALYVALTLHYVALKRLNFFCTDVHYGPCPARPLREEPCPNARHRGAQPLGEGLYTAPFLNMETRHGFGVAGWVLSNNTHTT